VVRRPSWRLGALGIVLTAAGLAGCSSSSSSASAATATTVLPAGVANPLRVDLIAPAVKALEAQLGGAQHYFEIDATPALVNLHVATGSGASMTETAWVYIDGVLTSHAPQPASGNTFVASALDVDPSKVTATVTKQLPTSGQDAFVVVGGPGGAVQYSIVTTSPAGGQLIVVVGKDGAILSVVPADATADTGAPTTVAAGQSGTTTPSP
jgi:hypothetical protein